MRYPTFGDAAVKDFAARLIAGEQIEPAAFDGAAQWIEAAPLTADVDLGALRAAVTTVIAGVEAEVKGDLWKDADRVEGHLALLIQPTLSALPVEVLDDGGFWRFLSIGVFWPFIAWRESSAIERGNVDTYVNGRRNTENIPMRLYLRARAVDTGDDDTLASDIPKAADFWRSHVLRTQTAAAPVLARSLATMQLDARLSAKEIRPLARRLNRVWTNALLFLYSPAEADALIEQLRVGIGDEVGDDDD